MRGIEVQGSEVQGSGFRGLGNRFPSFAFQASDFAKALGFVKTSIRHVDRTRRRAGGFKAKNSRVLQ